MLCSSRQVGPDPYQLGVSRRLPLCSPRELGVVLPGAQLLAVELKSLVNLHAGARVEPRSAAGTVRIDTERDVALPPLVELREGRPQQREGKPAPSPWTPHAHAVDPAAPARNQPRETDSD